MGGTVRNKRQNGRIGGGCISWRREGSGTNERDGEGIYIEEERERERGRTKCLGLGDDGEK